MKSNFPLLSYECTAGFIPQSSDINFKKELLRPWFILLFFIFPLNMQAQTSDANRNDQKVTEALSRANRTEKKQVDKSIPICIHPENPKCFLFRGKPLVFLTATEHYGSVINRPFRFERYLADVADKHMTFTSYSNFEKF